MNFNRMEQVFIKDTYETQNSPTSSFLGQEIDLIINENILEIENSINILNKNLELEIGKEGSEKKFVSYDKHNKGFFIDNNRDEKFSIGQIVSARRYGINFCLPETLIQSGDGKKLIRIMLEKMSEDALYSKLNKELATVLSDKTQKSDALVSKAYGEIAERSGKESKQLGIMAEKIMMGVLERIAIDRSDLGISVREANAFEDVENKIDFIISSKHKVRGVGINRQDFTFEEKSIGVQFTTNLSAKEHKYAQINKAKEKGVDVDDIIYVELNPKILGEAVRKWETDGKKITGPFEFLSKDLQSQVIINLLKGTITEEQEKSLKIK
ncbi:MAG: hypothetical protein NTU81_02060 [Candidatus Nomurabacteria bacterium]|nr:hypothetical protein [Candidatus Nomurabacteria bacterium]